MKASGYIRVSTLKQAQEGESLNLQKKQIKDYIKAENWQLFKVYADKGISGTSTEGRKDFKRMIEDAKKGKFNILVTPRLTRFARNARDLLNKVEELKSYGVKFVSLKEKIDMTTPYGEFMLTMLAAVAQLERDTIVEQTRENRHSLWFRKDISMGQAPYGYRWSEEKKMLVAIKEEAEIYKQIVNLYLNLGIGIDGIAAKLKADGIKSRQNRNLAPATISGFLKNPVYYGR